MLAREANDGLNEGQASHEEDTTSLKDPLTWPLWRKNLILLTVSLNSFTGPCGGLANAAGLETQALVYGNQAIDMSYTLSAFLAGQAVGPFLWQPFSIRYGKPPIIFWGSFFTLVANIWAACSTGHDAYGSFLGSRILAGLAGGAGAFVGGRVILDLYPLHQRGRAFTFYTMNLVFGSLCGPLFSGYIVYYASWPIQYWYNVGLDAAILIFTFITLEETSFPRDGGRECGIVERSWLKRRLIMIPGALNPHPKLTSAELRTTIAAPWLILLSPNGFIACLGLFVYYGFAAGFYNVLAVFLQTPQDEGGYGLNPKENSNFLFCQWVGVAIAYVYGTLYNDRLPLWYCRLRGGVWRPEYRLLALVLPCVIMFPIGYGVIGVVLRRHMDVRIAAVGTAMVIGSSLAILSPFITYLTECFMKCAGEANVIANISRVGLGIAFPFFVLQWQARIGVVWLFGMIAFFNLATFLLIIFLWWKGEAIRKFSFRMVAESESGRVIRT